MDEKKLTFAELEFLAKVWVILFWITVTVAFGFVGSIVIWILTRPIWIICGSVC